MIDPITSALTILAAIGIVSTALFVYGVFYTKFKKKKDEDSLK